MRTMIVFLAMALVGLTTYVNAQASEVLFINETGVECVVRPYRNSMMIQCAESDPVEDRIFTPINPADHVNECGNECARRRRDEGFPCTGFIYRMNTFPIADRRLSCTMLSCRNLQKTTQVGLVAVAIRDECFATGSPSSLPTSSPSVTPSFGPTTMAPTGSPTYAPTTSPPSRAPTRRPTKTPSLRPTNQPTTGSPVTTENPTSTAPTVPTFRPTSEPTSTFPTRSPTLPTASPTIARTASPTSSDGGFVSPSGIWYGAPFDRSMFVKVNTNPNLCMIARPQRGSFSVSYKEFGGSVNLCMRECQYDAFCTGVLYSQKYDECIKAIVIETTDDSVAVDDYTANWVSYVKDKAPVPYYANFCGQFNAPNTCSDVNSDNQCKWGFGPRGYNQNRHTDEFYCGRIACNK